MSDTDEGDDFSPEKEREMEAFFGSLALAMRASIARGLLAGNDTGCFSTEQYATAYHRRHPVGDLTPEQLWHYVTPESHLKSIPNVVREVAPGVWAAAEGASDGT